jgi:hypothetical protein
MRYLRNSIALFLTISLLASCAGIPARMVKLDEYVEEDFANDRSLSYRSDKSYGDLDSSHQFDGTVISDFNLKIPRNDSSDKSCLIKFASKNGDQLDGICKPYFILSYFTLFTIPFYCQHSYEVKAVLMSQQKDPTTNITQNKVLKEYHLKDKLHEVWSLLWMFNPWSWDEPASDSGKRIVERNISEAFVRQVIHDANSFEECKK